MARSGGVANAAGVVCIFNWRQPAICHETVRLWWNRFGPMFAGEIRRKRVQHMRAYTHPGPRRIEHRGLPRRTLWDGPRTEAAGLSGTTSPITSQSARPALAVFVKQLRSSIVEIWMRVAYSANSVNWFEFEPILLTGVECGA